MLLAMLRYFAVFVLAGCMTESLDYASAEQAVEASNRLASNRLASNRLASNRLASNSLAVSALPGESPLIETADGRDVLSYIITCALASSQQLVLEDSAGTSYTFGGLLGLAPEWATRPPTIAERRWVTACVLARTNLYGVPVMLSMRGAHAELAISPDEETEFALLDGAFYGDLFDPAGPTELACDGSAETGDADPTTSTLRRCADSDDGATTLCEFTATGTCSQACASAAPYVGCAGGDTSYDEVITVFIQE